jgi:hypothetical protein
MQHTNAILAINSLDRYITSQTNLFSRFLATWANGATTLTWVSGDIPVVGALLTSLGVNATVIAWDPLTNTITISAPTTTAQVLSRQVNQLQTIPSSASQPVQSSLIGSYLSAAPYANSFTISSPGALIYGYINKIIVSQIQVQYNVPTVNAGLNDKFYLYSGTKGDYYEIGIPFGFYTGSILAAVLQAVIVVTNSDLGFPPIADMTVQYFPNSGFKFESVADTFRFPTPEELDGQIGFSQERIATFYKTLRLLGMTPENDVENNEQSSTRFPIFLYTPYIDIYSDVLTNYQDMKDTNTSISKNKGLIARVYLSGVGNPQNTNGNTDLGTVPFIMTADLNNPKIIQWSPDVAVPSIDFQVYDQYNQLLPMGPLVTSADTKYQTEFQITLLCSE